MNNLELSIILPVYNEESNINLLIKDLSNSFNQNTTFEYEILFIDNCSTDRSYELLKSFRSNTINVYRNNKNILYSGSVLRGIKLSKGNYIAVMDSDLQFHAKDILKLLKEIKDTKSDIIFGRRCKRNDGFSRVIFSKLFNLLSKIIFKCSLDDLNTGLKVMKKKSFFDLRDIYEINMINPDLYAHAKLNNLSIREIDINHSDRVFGVTSHSLSILSSLILLKKIIVYFFFIRNKIFR